MAYDLCSALFFHSTHSHKTKRKIESNCHTEVTEIEVFLKWLTGYKITVGYRLIVGEKQEMEKKKKTNKKQKKSTSSAIYDRRSSQFLNTFHSFVCTDLAEQISLVPASRKVSENYTVSILTFASGEEII